MTSPSILQSRSASQFVKDPMVIYRKKSFFISCDFSCDFTKSACENLWFKLKLVNFMYCWPNNSIKRYCEHKHLRIKQFDTLHNLWLVVQNVYFAKSQEKPHKKLIFKHFGLSVPNLRKQNPARIRFRMTQKNHSAWWTSVFETITS